MTQEHPKDTTGGGTGPAPAPDGAAEEQVPVPDGPVVDHPDVEEPVEAGADAGADADAEAAPPADGGDGEADDPDALRTRLQEVAQERDTYLAHLQRARADYDNLNKRKTRELMGALDRGGAAVVERMLDVLDNFSFALQAASESEDTQLAKGVEMVHSQLLQALKDAGLEEVAGTGAPFDPAHHEALMQTEDGQEREHPEVVEVLRTGYRFKGHLLRPAAVKVVR